MTKSLQKLLTTLFVLSLFSANVFGVPQVTFTLPTAGQTYTVGVDASIPVTFEVTNVGSTSFALYLMKSDYSGITLLTTLPPSNGTATYNYSLISSQFPGSYKFMVKEENSPVELAYSDVFAIQNSNKIITISKPETGTTCFSMQQTMQIEWRSNAISIVNILYSINNGNSWNTIANNISSSDGYNTFSWQIPNFAESTEQCNIKVEENDGDPSIVSNLFRISQPESFGFNKPLGTETYTVGVNQDIPLEIYYTGCSELNPTTGGNVFSIMLNGSASYNVGVFDQVIKENSSWTYTYTLPNNVIPGSYKFSYSSQGKTFQSPGTITINNNQKFIDISDTVENAYYTVNQIYPVWWSALNVGAVNIYYSIDNGTTWSEVATNVPSNNGHNTHLWTIPSSITSTHRECKIKITDVATQTPDDISLKFTLSNLPKFTIQSPLGNSSYTVGTDTEIPFTVANNSADNGNYSIYLNDKYVTSMSIGSLSSSTFNYSIPLKINSGSYRFKIQTGSETFYSEYFNVVNNSYAYKFLDPIAGNSYSTCSSSVPVKIEFKGVGSISGSLDLEIIGFAAWVNITTLNLAADGILEYSFDIPVDMELGSYRFRFSCSEGIIYSENFNIKGSYPIFPTPVEGAVFNISETSIIPVTMQLYQSCQPIDFKLYISDGNGFSQLLTNSTINQSNPNYSYNYTIPSNLPSGEYEFLIERWIPSTSQWGVNYSSKFLINTTPFAGGDGTQANPYRVSNATQLNAVRNYLGAYFIQTADIDLGVAPWNEGEGWLPIGTSTAKFTGKYDGQNFAISNMKINRPALAGVGLFGWASGATISNVKLNNVDITGLQRIGALVGSIHNNGVITNCSSSGITQGGNFTSGLVGNLYYGSSITQSYSSCIVTANASTSQQTGGLVGRALNGFISFSYTSGKVTGNTSVGGLVGYVSDNSGTTNTSSNITNCYSTAEVFGNTNSGGLVGYLTASNLSNCYSTGPVQRGTDVNGLVGFANNSTFENCFWNIESSLQPISPVGSGLNTAQMVQQNNFTGWDFLNSWKIENGTTYPYLKWQENPVGHNYPENLPPINFTAIGSSNTVLLSWSAGSIGSPSKYKVYRDNTFIGETSSTSYSDGGLINYTEHKYYVTAVYGVEESKPSSEKIVFVFEGFSGGDGSLASPYEVSTAWQLYAVRYFLKANFIQTANIDINVAPFNEGEGWLPISIFEGKFNGQGYAINGLFINRQMDKQGLFGYTWQATIENLRVTNVNINTLSRTGAVVGFNSRSTILNCMSSGIINSTGAWIGGLVGVNYYNSSIQNSFSTITINSSSYDIGGLSGTTESTSSVINCYATGCVTGSNMVGGLIGWIDNTSNIERCYSLGAVNGASDVGGLFGVNSSTIVDSYWDTESSLISTSVGGTGKTTAEMLQQTTFNSWDFTNIWGIRDGISYPYLKWQTSAELFNYPPASLVPQNLAASIASQTSLLTWEAPLKGMPTKYEIYRDNVKVGESTVNSYTDNGLTNKTIYSYHVVAIHGSVISNKSNSISLYVFSGFAGGDGTDVNPYLVSNAEQLDAVRYYLTKHFRQTADIDLGVAPWTDGDGWKPIGEGANPILNTSENPFSGVYDGGNFKISNLRIVGTTSRELVGLFGYTRNATIQNVDCHNVSINCTYASVGAVAGKLISSSLINSRVSGLVKSTSIQIGGLVGWSNASIVTNCYSSANVETSNIYAGGLVGVQESNSRIQNSWSSGIVTGLKRVGGVLGYNSNSTVQDCYSSSSVSGENTIGGLIGYSSGTSSSISNCYAGGSVTGTQYTGGLIGIRASGSDPVNCYWNTESCGQSASGGGIGRVTLQMLTNANYTGWDFTGVWDIQEGITYPYLRIQVSPSSYNYPVLNAQPSTLTSNMQLESIVLSWNAPSTGTPQGYNVYRNGVKVASNVAVTSYVDQELVEYTNYSYCVTAIYGSIESDFSNTVNVYYFKGFDGGDGTVNNPYLISNAGQLNAVRHYLSSHFKQTANIDLGVAPWNVDKGWVPLGSAEQNFTGSYDGGGYIINNLTINNTNLINVGLFGVAGGADILFKNITLNNPVINAGQNAGSLVGWLSPTVSKIVINSVFLNNVSISGSYYIGGIIGYGKIYNGSIQNSSITGTVSGVESVGGIVGNINNASIIQCYSSASVTGNRFVGGIVGVFQHGSIVNCYSAGSISGSNSAGIAANINNLTIENCYSVAKLIGDSDVGGLVANGTWGKTPTVINSYWDQERTNITFSNGGVGKSTMEMLQQTTFNSWDFTNIWSIGEDVTYPYLKWQVNPKYFNIPDNSLKPLNLTAVTNNQVVTLTWDSPIFGNPNKYFIYRNSEKIGESNTLSFTNSNLTNNTTYQYYVTAVFEGVEKTPSNTVSVYVSDGIISGTDDNNNSTTAPNWTRLKQYGGTGANIAQVVTADANFVYFVANVKESLSFGGQIVTCVGDNDLLIAKYTKTGTPVWVKTLNAQTEGLLSADALKIDGFGNLYLAATIKKGVVTVGSSVITCSSILNSFIAKFDSNGNGLWASGFYNALVTSNLNPTRIAIDSNSDVYLLSKSSLLVKYSPSGAKQWEQAYPNRTLQAITIKGNTLYLGGALQNGTTYFGGLQLNSGGGYNTGFIVKGDLNGNYTQSLAGFNTNGDGSVVSDIFVDDNNDLFVSGGYYSKFFMGSLAISTNTGKYHAYLAKFDSNMNSLWIKKSSSITDNTRSFIWSTRLYSDNSGNLYQFGSNTGSFTYESTPISISTGNQFLVKFDLSGNIISNYSLANTSKDRVFINEDGKFVTVTNELGGNFRLSQYSGITTQDWAISSTNTTYGTAIANFTKVDKYGNYFVLSTANGKCDYFGNSFNDNESYKLLAKHDITGNLIWVRKIKGLINGGSQGSNIALDKDNNIAITGQFISLLNAGSVSISQNNSYTHGVVLKYNSNGDIVSTIQIKNVSGGNLTMYTPTFDNVGNLVVSGVFSKVIQIGGSVIYGNAMDDVFMAKFDINGNYLWSKSFCGSEMEWLGLLSCDANNNIYMAGEFHSNPIQIGNISLSINTGDGSTVLAKFDPNGNALWAKTYGGVIGANPDSWPVNIRTDIQGNTFLWGWCPNNSAFGSFTLKNTLANSYMYYLCKINTNGEVIWAKAIEEKNYDFNYHDLMDIDNYGNVYVGGHLKDQYKVDGKLYNIRGVEDFFIAKYSSNGILQWMKSEPQMVFQNGTIQSLAVYRNNTLIVSGNHSGKLSFGDKIFKSTGQNAFIAVLGELPALPVAVTKPASVNSKKSGEVTVLLNGIANANNNDASIIFEYGTTTAYGSSIAGNPSKISGNSNVSINSSFEGIDSEVYHYRLKVETPEGVVYGDDMTISAQLPAATTLAASGVNFSSAQVNGKVNAKGNSVGVGFEYGLSTAYGTTVTANPVSLSSNTDVSVSASLSDLSPNTTYHFRVFTIGDNSVYGEDLTFTTGSLTPIAIIQTASSIAKTTATLNGMVNASDFNVTVEFEYGTTSSYGNTVNASPFNISGNILQSVGAAISGLQAGTMYKYRIKVSGASNIVYSDELTFTTLPEPPIVTTIAASNILATGALARGTVNPNGATTAVYIDYGTTNAYGDRIFANQTSIDGGAVVDVDKMLSGLDKNTEYHFRILAVNAGGTSYGDDLVFTTLLESKPTVVTSDVLDITRSSAKINGLVNSNKNETTVEFKYGEDNSCAQTATVIPALVSGSTETNVNVEATLIGLKSNTTYYYKLKGVNVVGESMGEVKSFKTLPSKPIAITQLAKNISKSGAVLAGVANANSVLTNAVFEYGLTTDYGTQVNATPLSISGNTNEQLSAIIVGLAGNTTYHFRLKASSSDGISYGDDITFTTLPLDPTVNTLDATEVGSNSAMFNGIVNANNSSSQVEFDWGVTPSFGQTISATPLSVSGSKVTSVLKEIAGLQPNTQYYYRVKATNAGGVIYGEEKGFKTKALRPSMLSSLATNITSVSVSLKGVVKANGANTQVTFEYGLSNNYGSSVNATPFAIEGNAETNVEALIENLIPNTVYHFRVKAENSGGVSYSDNQTFTTKALSPAIISAQVSDVTTNSSILKGRILANGVNTNVRFEYGALSSCDLFVDATPSTITGISETDVQVAVSGLTPNTVYYFRVKAESSGGISYSNAQTFTTMPLAPSALLLSVTDITSNTATLNGKVVANGVNTEVVFEYGKNSFDNAVNANPYIVSGSNETAVTIKLDALEKGTTYQYRLKASSIGGVFISETGTFTTTTTDIDDNLSSNLNVYPNPAQDFVYLVLSEGAPLSSIEVFDLAGTLKLNTICSENPHKIDITNLPNGVYLVKVKTSNGVLVAKLIVDRKM